MADPSDPAPATVEELQGKITGARRRMESALDEARSAKAEYKRARKVFKQAKKLAKKAKRKLEALEEDLTQARARKRVAVKRRARAAKKVKAVKKAKVSRRTKPKTGNRVPAKIVVEAVSPPTAIVQEAAPRLVDPPAGVGGT